jgi:hypothetical protein
MRCGITKSEIKKHRAGFQPDFPNRADFQPDVTMIVQKWHANVRTEEIEELLAGSNFDWTLPASQVAKHSDQGSP